MQAAERPVVVKTSPEIVLMTLGFYFVLENLVLRARSEAVGPAAVCLGKNTVARRQNSSMALMSLRSTDFKIE